MQHDRYCYLVWVYTLLDIYSYIPVIMSYSHHLICTSTDTEMYISASKIGSQYAENVFLPQIKVIYKGGFEGCLIFV